MRLIFKVDKFRTFERHPFKVLDDKDMNNLIKSKAQGIISPLIVRTNWNMKSFKNIGVYTPP